MLRLQLHGNVLEVTLAKQKKGNAVDFEGFAEIKRTFDAITAVLGGTPPSMIPGGIPKELENADIRCVVMNGEGKNFCVGIDLMSLGEAMQTGDDAARNGLKIRTNVLRLQECISAIEACPVPVIMAVHGACYGLGVDIITAGDIRVASKDAMFSVKEIDLSIVADIGTLQRLPFIVGNHSAMKTWALTGKAFTAEEALRVGLISEISESPEALRKDALALATTIASKPPVAVVGTKFVLNSLYQPQIQQGLQTVATLNASLIQTKDLEKMVMLGMSAKKKKAGEAPKPVVFSKL